VIEDRAAIEQLLYGYAERMDAGDFEGVAALFAQATYGAADGPRLEGRAQVLAALESMVLRYDGVPRTKHVTTNVIVEVDDARRSATVRSYFTVLQSFEGRPIRTIVAGRYHDRFACGAGGWHFVERVIFMDMVGDLGEHLRVPAA
jgi:3-phenylpropionate/cinnamic acid dioxygenase small subunit